MSKTQMEEGGGGGGGTLVRERARARERGSGGGEEKGNKARARERGSGGREEKGSKEVTGSERDVAVLPLRRREHYIRIRFHLEPSYTIPHRAIVYNST